MQELTIKLASEDYYQLVAKMKFFLIFALAAIIINAAPQINNNFLVNINISGSKIEQLNSFNFKTANCTTKVKNDEIAKDSEETATGEKQSSVNNCDSESGENCNNELIREDNNNEEDNQYEEDYNKTEKGNKEELQ